MSLLETSGQKSHNSTINKSLIKKVDARDQSAEKFNQSNRIFEQSLARSEKTFIYKSERENNMQISLDDKLKKGRQMSRRENLQQPKHFGFTYSSSNISGDDGRHQNTTDSGAQSNTQSAPRSHSRDPFKPRPENITISHQGNNTTQSVIYGMGLLDQTDFFAQGLGRQQSLERVDERSSENETVDASLSMVDESTFKVRGLGRVSTSLDEER